MKRLSHGPGPHYLYKPLLHHVMPHDVKRLILLDTDKNGGVQLFDLAAMRAEPQYDAILDYVASGRDGRRIGYLGDQTLYSFLAPDFPYLFYRLPCEWNRQISMHFGFHNTTVHHCPQRCGILHANYQPFKCVARLLQASPSCTTWRDFQRRLALPSDPRYPCPKLSAGQKLAFKRAITRFFDTCCIDDGLVTAGARRSGQRQKKLAALLT